MRLQILRSLDTTLNVRLVNSSGMSQGVAPLVDCIFSPPVMTSQAAPRKGRHGKHLYITLSSYHVSDGSFAAWT